MVSLMLMLMLMRLCRLAVSAMTVTLGKIFKSLDRAGVQICVDMATGAIAVVPVVVAHRQNGAKDQRKDR